MSFVGGLPAARLRGPYVNGDSAACSILVAKRRVIAIDFFWKWLRRKRN